MAGREKNKPAEANFAEIYERVPDPDFPIVGIGAPAGGLEALESFMDNMPANSGMAFVVPHPDLYHWGMLAELLQRATLMPVMQFRDLTRVEPNSVTIIPPKKIEAELRARAVRLRKPLSDQQRGEVS